MPKVDWEKVDTWWSGLDSDYKEILCFVLALFVAAMVLPFVILWWKLLL